MLDNFLGDRYNGNVSASNNTCLMVLSNLQEIFSCGICAEL
jgi:hypothetical protein